MIIEIRAGEGGRDSELFVGELAQAYRQYLESAGWLHRARIEEGFAELEAADVPGFRHEAGVHRIQRVPSGEKRGRVHSSTVTVSILEGRQSAMAALRENDLKYRWFSGTGPGGQNRNKVQCCLEITHLPTGLTQSAHSRSREDNIKTARASLEMSLKALFEEGQHFKINSQRVEQIGRGTRGERRRLYRFQDDKIIDYQTGLSMRLKDFMRGKIDKIWSS